MFGNLEILAPDEDKFCLVEIFAIKFVTLSDRSLFIAGGGARIWVADHLIFRRTKGGISRD